MMSCGREIKLAGLYSRYEMADQLRATGDYDLAHKLEHNKCFTSHELRRLEDSFDNAGLIRGFDYRERDCHRDT